MPPSANPSIMLDPAFFRSQYAAIMRRELGDPCAEFYAIRLWCWAMEQRNETGHLILTPEVISEVAGDRVPGTRVFDAMLKAGLLRVRKRGFYMAGWSRNTKYWTYLKDKARRMKELREERAREREEREEERRRAEVLPEHGGNMDGTLPRSVLFCSDPKNRKKRAKGGGSRTLQVIHAGSELLDAVPTREVEG